MSAPNYWQFKQQTCAIYLLWVQMSIVGLRRSAAVSGKNRLCSQRNRRTSSDSGDGFRRFPDVFARNANRVSVPFFDRDRADLDEFMLVVRSMPVSPLTMPVAVMLMMPVLIIPVVIALVFVGHCRKRGANERSNDKS